MPAPSGKKASTGKVERCSTASPCTLPALYCSQPYRAESSYTFYAHAAAAAADPDTEAARRRFVRGREGRKEEGDVLGVWL